MRLHRIGLAVKDIGQAVRQYEGILGIVLSTAVTEDKMQQVRVALAQVSTNVWIEFIEPTAPSSPIARLVAQGGGIYYHLCYATEDIDVALEQARSNGALVISGPVPATAFDGRRIAFLMMPDRSLVEFLEE